jgi:UDP-N-acetylglucosamine 4,6-dehydratase
VTGGTGSFGKAFVQRLLNYEDVEKIVVFSRDELKQFEMAENTSSSKIRYVLGDIRDYQRLLQITTEIDIVVHAAAMKQIPSSELNPFEAVKTNIFGAENVVNAAITNGVKKVIALSTDKAANPANLYGATKLCSDRLIIAGNTLARSGSSVFSAVRYGNVLGSRGSVIPFFLERAKIGSIPITDERMTRFWLTIQDAVQFVIDCLERMKGGEIFVPKIPSFKVVDVARLVCPGIPLHHIGIRPGEKLHEVMITEDDSLNTYDFGNYFAIVPSHMRDYVLNNSSFKAVSEGFRYSSDNNPLWHTDETFINTLRSAGILP